MRRDHFSSPAKWTREFRQALKMSHRHFAVYAYLEGGLESHRTGIYFVTVSAVAEMTNTTRDDVRKIMEELESVGLINWDSEFDVVWIPCVCAEQFRWRHGTGSAKDNKAKEAVKHVAKLPKSRLVDLFLANWPVFREGAWEGAWEGTPYTPSRTHTHPSPAPDAPAKKNGGDL